MVFKKVSPVKILNENLFKDKLTKAIDINLKNSSMNNMNNFDKSLSESNNKQNEKFSKILSENDLLRLGNSFYDKNLNDHSKNSINKSKYSLQNFNFENNKNDYLNGDVDFNGCDLSNNSDDVNNSIKSATSQSNRKNKPLKINKPNYLTKQFKDPYFQRMKSKNRSASSYIYERKATSTKNIRINLLENDLQIDGRHLLF